MVHGPHGIPPVPMPHFLNFPPPSPFLGGPMSKMQYPPYLMHHPMYAHGFMNPMYGNLNSLHHSECKSTTQNGESGSEDT